MNWGVMESYKFTVAEIVKTTAVTVLYQINGLSCRATLSKLTASGLDEESAKLLAERLNSARAEQRRREQAARAWFHDEKGRYVKAAIERAAVKS